MLQRMPGYDPPCSGWSEPDRPARPSLWRIDIHIVALLDRIDVWSDRARRRRQLARMSPTEMRDLAASRTDVMNEINKPFWRP